MRYILIALGGSGFLLSLVLVRNSNFHQVPDFQTMTGLAVAVCSAISLIAGIATWDIVNAIESGAQTARTQRAGGPSLSTSASVDRLPRSLEAPVLPRVDETAPGAPTDRPKG